MESRFWSFCFPTKPNILENGQSRVITSFRLNLRCHWFSWWETCFWNIILWLTLHTCWHGSLLSFFWQKSLIIISFSFSLDRLCTRLCSLLESTIERWSKERVSTTNVFLPSRQRESILWLVSLFHSIWFQLYQHLRDKLMNLKMLLYFSPTLLVLLLSARTLKIHEKLSIFSRSSFQGLINRLKKIKSTRCTPSVIAMLLWATMVESTRLKETEQLLSMKLTELSRQVLRWLI